MNRLVTITLTALLLAPLAGLSAADGLVVYPRVPRLAASEHYKVRVRPARDGSTWRSSNSQFGRVTPNRVRAPGLS
jgi:hypothetical protein